MFGNRRGLDKNRKQGQTIRVLRYASPLSITLHTGSNSVRNIDRILSASTPSNNGMLSYKEHGLLLCEVHVLRQRAASVVSGEIYREFLEDVNELVDIRTGIARQLKVVERIRWAYAKWLQ